MNKANIKNIIFILLLALVKIASGQSYIDSLFVELKNTNEDGKKTDLLFEIANEYQYHFLDSSIIFLNKALNIAMQSEDIERIKKILLQTGKFYLYNADIEAAREVLDKCLLYANADADKKAQGNVLHLIDYSYYADYDFPNALNYYYEALKIRESIKDSAAIGATKNNIGLIFWQLHQYYKALFYLKQSLEIGLKYNDLNVIGSGYTNLGMIYSQINKIDSSNIFFKKSLKISKQIDNVMYISSDYTNIGANFIIQDQHDSAKYYLTKAYNLEKNIGREFYLATITSNLCNIYLKNQMYDSAMILNSIAEQKSLTINAIDLLEYIYDLKAQIYFNIGDYKQAYIFSRIHDKYADSLYNENIFERITTLENQFSLKKKQEEIDFQELLLERQKFELKAQKRSMLYLKLFILSLIVFGFIIAWTLVKNIKAYKLLEIKSQKIELQSQKIKHQNTVIGAYNEEIKSSLKYAGDIVSALLPQKSELQKSFNIFTIFYPKEIVSGDFYQYFETNNSHIFIVGDCSGHGVPGALLATLTMRIINRIVNSYKIIDPLLIMEKLDSEFRTTLKQEQELNSDGVDLGIVKICNKTGNDNLIKVNFSGAHRDLYYFDFSTNTLQKIKGTRGYVGIPLNLKQEFSSNQIELSKNTMLYLFTDGYVDQCNNNQRKIGRKMIEQKMIEFSNLEIDHQKNAFQSFFNDWKQEHFQIDDATFVGLRLGK